MKNIPENVYVFDHPLIMHKVSILRDENTGMKEFRELIEEITTLMTYESMRDVDMVPVEVKTPLETTTQYRVPDGSVVIVPILRAGLGMVNGIHTLFPTARVGHIPSINTNVGFSFISPLYIRSAYLFIFPPDFFEHH